MRKDGVSGANVRASGSRDPAGTATLKYTLHIASIDRRRLRQSQQSR